MRAVSAAVVMAVAVAVGIEAQMIVRRRVDGPDNRVLGTCSPPNKPPS